MEDIKIEKKAISFKRKPAKMGEYYIFSIPAEYVKNGLIDPDKMYRVYVTEEMDS